MMYLIIVNIPVSNMVKDTSISKVMIIFLAITLVSGTSIANFIPVHAIIDCDGHPATIVGTSGDDVIDGTTGDDVILGLDGNDIINGNGGNDIVCSGNDNDIVITGSGDDEIYGEGGFDSFDAGDGVNIIDADFGIEGDTITTGKGNDFIILGDGVNVIDAGDGDNEITTGSGDDQITSGNGDDKINAGDGVNVIDAGDGDNIIDGESKEESEEESKEESEEESKEESEEESKEEFGQIEFSIQAVGGTATVQITKDGEETELEIDFNNAVQVLNEIKQIVGLDVNDVYSEWTFEASSEEENIEISIEVEDGVANVEIEQDGETINLEMASTKRNKIRNEIQSVTGINLNTIDFDWILEMKINLYEKKVTLCHIPSGNPLNSHILSVAVNSKATHLDHGDYLGKCTGDKDELEKRELIKKIKKQREEIRDKNELKEKRNAIKEIKNELKDLKNLDVKDKEKLKDLVEDIKKVLEKLNENPEYIKEHKKLLKTELKETKTKIDQNMTPEERVSKHKVDSKVYSLSKSDDPKLDAKKLGLDYKNGETTIAIKLSKNNQKVLQEIGSVATIDAKNKDHVQVKVKLKDLPKLRAIDGIEKIRAPFTAIQYEEELSEGVYFMNADLAQYQGITGKGVKVAVLDLSFTNNPKISDNIIEVKSFRAGVNVLPIQWTGDEALHGTAVAEIITDVAPNAELYLYSMETDIEFASAVDWAISKKLDIIVMSAGWPNFPTDGTSHITKKIEEAVDNGIVFVVPAGNFANKHWEGNFADSNFNNWHDYSDSDEGLSISVSEQRIEEETPIVTHLMWDVNNSDVADFELVLVDPLGQIVAFSANEQIRKSDTPFEYIHHIPEIEGIYSIGVLYAGDMSKVSQRPSATLELFSINDELEYPVTHSSVSVPADADGAIVVGAINHLDGVLEPFSSQGPTNNGKLAPHVVGPDGVTTLALDGKPFFGTSATTPYVAGLAALILETNPDISPKELLTKIQQNTDSSFFSLPDGFDYSLGYGPVNAFFLIDDAEVQG